MSSRSYPRIGRKIKEIKNPQHQRGGKGASKPCILCGAPTTARIEIQTSIFRGDDEVEPCCNTCMVGNQDVLLESIMDAWEEVNG